MRRLLAPAVVLLALAAPAAAASGPKLGALQQTRQYTVSRAGHRYGCEELDYSRGFLIACIQKAKAKAKAKPAGARVGVA